MCSPPRWYLANLSNIGQGGHGISIGSVGGRSNNVVDTVTIKDCTVVDSENGELHQSLPSQAAVYLTAVSHQV